MISNRLLIPLALHVGPPAKALSENWDHGHAPKSNGSENHGLPEKKGEHTSDILSQNPFFQTYPFYPICRHVTSEISMSNGQITIF